MCGAGLPAPHDLPLFAAIRRYRAFGQLPPTTDSEFLIDVAEVSLHGLDGKMELLGDLPVGSADLRQTGDAGFLRTELVGSQGASASAGSPPLGPCAVGMPASSAIFRNA